jgi:hypothetical protein
MPPRRDAAAQGRNLNSNGLPLKLQDATVEVERLGELFLTNREQQVATDRQRNAVREALTALRKRHGERKAWVRSSSCSFQRCATADAAALLEQGVLCVEGGKCLVPHAASAHTVLRAPANCCRGVAVGGAHD